MPLRAHLAELRKRVILVAVGVAVGAVIGWFFFTPAFEALQQPVLDAAQQRDTTVTVNFAGLATALDMRIKVSLFLGLLISAPWWLYQMWAFVAPGLKSREKRYTVGFMAASLPLFGAGVTLGWLIFPQAVALLTEFTPANSANILDAQLYLSFAMRVFLAFGIAFVFPVVMVVLTWSGLVSTGAWLHGWRWAVVLIFAFAAMMTPTPDAITMVMMAIPMCALYFGAIGIGALHKRGQRK
jgi:sec-independent protein translocase protein TatC